MGQQQLILIIAGVIVVGIAISIGIFLFSGTSITANKDAIINDLMNLGQYAYRYKLRPEPLGGGGRYYTGFTLPPVLAANNNATYATVTTPNSVTITATSAFGYGTIVAVVDSDGTVGNYTYGGDLQ